MNLRSMSGAFPKAKLHTEDGSIAWYTNRASNDVLIVEDQLSAIRASKYLTAVALLGTNLNDERATEIRRNCKGNCYLALDADAWDKSVRLAVQHRSRLGPRLLRLSKDIKNMTKEEADEFFLTNC